MGRVTDRRKVRRIEGVGRGDRSETLVVEEPLEIRVNGQAVAVTMRTPGSDVELTQGFLLTEGSLPAATTCSPCGTARARDPMA